MAASARVEHTPSDERIQSIDALRGFDMLWISGGGEFLHALAVATSWTWAIAVARQFEHSRWAGCTFYDLIQPLFLFICGITLPLSIGRRMRRGQTRMQILRRLALRAVVLVILGQLDKNGPVSFDVAHIRFAGILQRIGVAGLAAGAIMMYARPRAQVLWVIGILGGYGALMAFVPAPGQRAPSFEPGVNIVDYLDQHVMPGRLDAGIHDAEGWFSTPPAVASVLFGALAGTWLLSAASVRRKVLGLLGAGAVLASDTDASLSDAVAAIDREAAAIPPCRPRSTGVWPGTARTYQQSIGNEPVLHLAAIVAIYLVLGILYESYAHPFTIISTLPSAGIGAVLALMLFNKEFSLIALIGVFLLIGIVKKNAIMMIDFAIEAERDEGLSPRDAIFKACQLRFRPILMTRPWPQSSARYPSRSGTATAPCRRCSKCLSRSPDSRSAGSCGRSSLAARRCLPTFRPDLMLGIRPNCVTLTDRPRRPST